MAWDQIKSPEQIERERLERWWRVDYRWDALGRKSWVGWVVRPDNELAMSATIEKDERKATVRDYWRRGPGSGRENSRLADEEIDAEMRAGGELIDGPSGSVWHICHLPLADKHGARTDKANWSTDDWQPLLKLARQRIAAAAETVTADENNNPSLERRALLQGIVMNTLDVPDGEINVLLALAYFSDHVDFSEASFRSACGFSSATFGGGVSFQKAVFLKDAWFDAMLVKQHARFEGSRFMALAHFDSALFYDYARFDDARFAGKSNFNSAIFRGYGRFDGARFGGPSSFQHTSFMVAATFERTEFADAVSFSDSEFQHSVLFRSRFKGSVGFQNALFAGHVSFDAEIRRPEADALRAFFGARFVGVADFSGAGSRIVAAFDHAVFEKYMILDNSSAAGMSAENAAEREFLNVILDETMKAADRNAALPADAMLVSFINDPWRYMTARRRLQKTRRNSRNLALSAVEGGCRTLKGVMERTKDDVREQRYHRFQLLARRRRSDTGLTERLLSSTYRVLSNYGTSPLRPLIWFAFSTVMFAVFYYLCGESIPPAHGMEPVIDSVRLSLSHALPFGLVLTGGRTRLGSQQIGLVFDVLLILQANISAVLIFLFALATKKMFQIR